MIFVKRLSMGMYPATGTDCGDDDHSVPVFLDGFVLF